MIHALPTAATPCHRHLYACRFCKSSSELNNTPCKPGDQIGFLLTFGDNEQLSAVLSTPTHGSLAIFKNGKRFGGGALYPGGSVDRAITLAVQLGCPGASVRLIPEPAMPWARQPETHTPTAVATPTKPEQQQDTASKIEQLTRVKQRGLTRKGRAFKVAPR